VTVVLYETALGGLGLLWLAPLWGVVRAGFFKLAGATVLACAALAWLAGRGELAAAGATGRMAALWLGLFAAAVLVWQVLLYARAGAARLARQLEHAGVRAGALHGNLAQPARARALAAFAAGTVPVLVATDIAAEDGAQAVLAAAGGRVDALANVAGVMDAFLPPAEVDDATWERVFAVNVTAPMRLTRAVLPLMLQAGGGAIVNVSSEASLRASASGVAYTASKHAVNGLTKSTAVFYKGQGIRANAVAPGPVATNIEAPFKSEHAAGVLGPIMQTTVPAIATAEQLAATICWLLSDDASNVNGAILPSDGGWSAI
jgi:NAD(P)-dependent dehydrogenase (short-subunit alcohol dehydrogenase family)